MVRVLVQSLKILTIAATAILLAAGSLAAFDRALDRARPADAGTPVEITVGEDDTTDQVADRLAEAGLIRSKLLFQGQLRVTGGVLKPGSYTLRKGMTVQQIIDRITGAEIAADNGDERGEEEARTFKVTVPEGWRLEQIAEEYEKQGGEGGFEAFMKAAEDLDVSAYDFLADRPDDASLEGYLFPDTYDFRSDNPTYNIQLMLDNFNKKVTPDMRDRAKEMGLSLHQVLTLASLVEKEAQVPEERPIIADVYLDRWVEGWKLDADPTVQYALGRPGDWWPKLSGDDLFADSPYNTYQIEGLPPAPICNPGLASIQAVLTPAETNYKYFVAIGDTGEHAFAETKEEHDANVAQYQSGDAGG